MAHHRTHANANANTDIRYPVDPGAQRHGQSAFEVDGISRNGLQYSM